MPLEIVEKRFLFKIKQVWFAENPHNDRDCSLIIFYDCKNKVDLAKIKRHDHFTLVIDLNQNLEDIWSQFNKTARNEIRRAYKEGFEIRINENFDDFYKLNLRFRRKKGLEMRGPNMSIMKKYGTLFAALKNGEILAGQLYYTDGQTMRWVIGASKRLEVSGQAKSLVSYANRMLVWEAIKYAKMKGVQEFDLGGYYIGPIPDEQKEKINFFKKGFGGRLVSRYHYFIYNSRILETLKKMRDFFIGV